MRKLSHCQHVSLTYNRILMNKISGKLKILFKSTDSLYSQLAIQDSGSAPHVICLLKVLERSLIIL